MTKELVVRCECGFETRGTADQAWLSREDQVVMAALSEEWKGALGDYVPEPFRNLI